jgi:trehalose 6-phosphate synthase/phosphatase
VKFLDYYSKSDLLDSYRNASKRLILLDYDGTLISFFPNPADAIPGESLIELLQKLNTSKNELCLVSGRNYGWLDKWFGSLNINIIAEHGGCIKRKGLPVIKATLQEPNWKEAVQQIMESYTRQCGNTFVEQKEYSLVWHYRNALVPEGKNNADKLYDELKRVTENLKFQVTKGNKIIEAKHAGIDKGTAIQQFLTTAEYDFIMAIGDDNTDEDMFQALTGIKKSFTIKVGSDTSHARYNLYTPQMIISLLETMTHISTNENL